jgi:hypothetical protein
LIRKGTEVNLVVEFETCDEQATLVITKLKPNQVLDRNLRKTKKTNGSINDILKGYATKRFLNFRLRSTDSQKQIPIYYRKLEQ